MKSREERIENIRRIQKAAIEDDSRKSHYPIKNWRGKTFYRKIIQVDSEFLMYRIENSRTEIQQLAHIRKNSLPKDFFNDPESPLVQQAQEEILNDMVTGKGKGLLEDLKIRKQDDACIITYDGYIVNGNRRTAGLKYLGERYIDCAVLPEDATPKDIYILEQQLQISEDFKEDYHWINELMNIRKGMQDTRIELKDQDVANNLRLDIKDVRVKLRTLDLIDAFLIWRKIPREYDYQKLDDAEEIFRQLEKAIKNYAKKDDSKRNALQNAVFTLIEEPPATGRLYGYVMDLIRTFEQVYVKMLQNTVAETTATPVKSKKESKDILDELIKDGQEPVASSFDYQGNTSDISNNLIDAIADVKAENKEKSDTEAVYESVSTALRELQGLTIDNDTAKIGSIKSKLEQIITVSKRLLEEVRAFENQ